MTSSVKPRDPGDPSAGAGSAPGVGELGGAPTHQAVSGEGAANSCGAKGDAALLVGVVVEARQRNGQVLTGSGLWPGRVPYTVQPPCTGQTPVQARGGHRVGVGWRSGRGVDMGQGALARTKLAGSGPGWALGRGGCRAGGGGRTDGKGQVTDGLRGTAAEGLM